MGKYIDYILLRLALFALVFACMYSLTQQLLEALLLSVVMFFALLLFLELVRRYKKKKYPYQKYARYFAIEGNETVKEYFKSTLKNERVIEETSDTLLTEKNGDLTVYAFQFRFSSVSSEDFAKCYRLAKKKNAKAGIVVGRETERSTLAILSEFSLPVSFFSGKELYKLLEKNQALPDLPITHSRQQKKIKTVLQIVFSENHAKHFLTTGIILAVFCIFTPLKLYYIITSCVAFVLGLICLILPHKKEAPPDFSNSDTPENKNE